MSLIETVASFLSLPEYFSTAAEALVEVCSRSFVPSLEEKFCRGLLRILSASWAQEQLRLSVQGVDNLELSENLCSHV